MYFFTAGSPLDLQPEWKQGKNQLYKSWFWQTSMEPAFKKNSWPNFLKLVPRSFHAALGEIWLVGYNAANEG